MILKEFFTSITVCHNYEHCDVEASEGIKSVPLDANIENANTELYEETSPMRTSIDSSDQSTSERAASNQSTTTHRPKTPAFSKNVANFATEPSSPCA
jgi:hypothetical protein